MRNNGVLVDFKKHDYRCFLLVVHEGSFMLLHCTRKKKKPHHWQLPGGNIDGFEFFEAGKKKKKERSQKYRSTYIDMNPRSV